MDKTYYTIYKIRNKINGKTYIGSHKTKNLEDGYMGSGKYLKYAIEKHGVDSFEKTILHIFDNPEQMYAKEAEIVNKDFLTTENTYNLRVGGFGGFDYVNSVRLNTKEHASQFKEAQRLGNISQSNIAKNIREDYDNNPNVCAFCKNPLSFYDRKKKYCNHSCHATMTNKNRKHSEETKRKISQSLSMRDRC